MKVEEILGEGSALERAQAEERRITLSARDDPNFKLPGGDTVAEMRRKLFEAQRVESQNADEAQSKRMVELHQQSEPLVNPDAKVLANETGGTTILPAKVEEPKTKPAPSSSPPKESTPKTPTPPVNTGKPEGEG